MRLLLDTHIWIWSLMSPEKLSEIVVEALENENNEIWLSPVSVWETLLLIEKGRILLTDISPEQWIRKVFRTYATGGAGAGSEAIYRLPDAQWFLGFDTPAATQPPTLRYSTRRNCATTNLLRKS